MKDKHWNIKELLAATADFFKEKNIESSRLDAEVLLAHILNMSRLQLYLKFDRPVDESELSLYRELVKRRARFEPVAYILGVREFMGRDFSVDRSVLVPRPETELIVEYIIKKYKDSAPRVLDIGTGSGAIAVCIKEAIPESAVFACDISAAALAKASQNAGGMVDFVRCSCRTAFKGFFDVVVSNPPYITESEMKELPPDVARWEPAGALCGGAEGLDIYRDIAKDCTPENTGEVVLEVSDTVSDAVCRIFEKQGFRNTTVMKDYANHRRIVCCVP